MPEVEKITPYRSGEAKEKQVEQMFDSIAPAYDFMNRAMTLGIDRFWRQRAVKLLRDANPLKVLDIATGTGDLAIKLAQEFPAAHIVGIDLSENMIRVGKEKINRLAMHNRIEFLAGDCLKLPFEDNTFDLITVAYGVRNFADIPAGYREMQRVLRPGGKLCVIELSVPASPVIRPLYKLYTSTLIPLAGRLISRDARAYSYLPESIQAAPQRQDMCRIIEQAGFDDAKFRSMTLGVCCIYTATVR